MSNLKKASKVIIGAGASALLSYPAVGAYQILFDGGHGLTFDSHVSGQGSISFQIFCGACLLMILAWALAACLFCWISLAFSKDAPEKKPAYRN